MVGASNRGWYDSASRSLAHAAEIPAAALSFGTFPSHSLVRLEGFYADLALHLSEKIHVSVRFGTSSSHQRFRERLQRQEFDIALVQASDVPGYATPQAYVPLLRLNAGRLVFFVSPNSDISTLADLRGRSLALPPIEEDSSSASLDRLRQAGLHAERDVSIAHLPQNSACLQHVLSGRSAAGAASSDALAFLGARAGVEYRVIDEGPLLDAPVIVVANRVSAEQRRAIQGALISWGERLRAQTETPGSWMTLTAIEPGNTLNIPGRRVTQSAQPRVVDRALTPQPLDVSGKRGGS